MNIQEEMAVKQRQYDDLTTKINGLPAGPVRFELKKRRNNLSGDIVALRSRIVQQEANSDNPQPVPRVSFGRESA